MSNSIASISMPQQPQIVAAQQQPKFGKNQKYGVALIVVLAAFAGIAALYRNMSSPFPESRTSDEKNDFERRKEWDRFMS